MDKVLKIFLKNSKVLKGQEIYCIRLNFNDGLDSLKSKVFIRCPQIKDLDPQIYWFDLENDRIRITCDDDLKFFMEESAVKKLIFDFHPDSEQETRKRSYSHVVSENEASEYSKRIRQQLQQIDLSSDSSSMDTDDDDAVTSFESSKNSSVNNVALAQGSLDCLIPSTSKQAQEEQTQNQKVNIISVDVIKPADPEMIVILDEPEDKQNVEVIKITDECDDDEPQSAAKDINDSLPKEVEAEKLNKQDQSHQKPATNRILISDSEEEETPANTNRNRRNSNSDAPFRTSSSAYSFANVNGEAGPNFRTWTGHSSHRRRGSRFHHHHRTASDSDNYFNEQARNFQRANAENIDRIHVHARMARDHAVNAVRASTSAIPDLLSSFQAHFRRPLFRVADINQQLFGSFNRR